MSLNNVKRNALAIEKVSYEIPKPSNEAVQSVNVLLKKNKAVNTSGILCELCSQLGKEKYCMNEWGLKIHVSRIHKKN